MLTRDARFTIDWSHAFRRNAARWLWDFRFRAVTYLELGVHEGRSACWMLEHILQHPASRYIGIDRWSGAPDVEGAEARARLNLRPYDSQVRLIKGRAQTVLAAKQFEAASVDVCYVDADHTPDGVFALSRLVWPLVKPGGIVVWDDLPRDRGQVALGLAQFLPTVAGDYEILFQNWQLGVRKRVRRTDCQSVRVHLSAEHRSGCEVSHGALV